MRVIKSIPLVWRLTLTFVLFAAVLLLGVGLLAYDSGRTTLRAATISELLSRTIEKEEALDDWAQEQMLDLATLASSPRLVEDARVLHNAGGAAPVVETARLNIQQELSTRTTPNLRIIQAALLHPTSGQIVVATNRHEAGVFRPNQPFFSEGKARPYLQNPYYSPALRRPVLIVSAPIVDHEGTLLAVLAAEISLDEIHRTVSRHSGLHYSDDAYLVDAQKFFITQPRFVEHPVILRETAQTLAVQECLRNTSGVLSAVDYRGVPAIIAYRWLAERELCLVVKIDEAEALGPALDFGKTILLISIVVLLAASALAIGLSQSITRPILALQAGAARFGKGQLDLRLPESRDDELGLLAKELNAMAAAIAEKELALRHYALELEQRVEERSRELRESELRFQSLVEVASDGIIISDSAGKIIFWNAAAQRIYGYEAAEVLGQSLALLIPEQFEERYRKLLARLLDSDGKWVGARTIEAYGRRADGREVPVELSLSTWQMIEDRFISIIVRDVSQRRREELELLRAKEAAESANQAKSSFLAMMSHEIRTPLNAIIGMTGLLLDTRLDREQRDFVETIRQSGDSLLTVINGILDFSKIEAGKLELEYAPFDLRECIESALDLVATSAAEKDLELAYVIEEGTPEVIIGDSTRLRQILVNLLTNAVKFTERGEIVVTLSSTLLPDEAYSLRCTVSDTGIGIPPGRIEHLFQPFSQLDASITRRYGGTGLGLVISRRLAELMGGGMWAESQPGQGSTFTFTMRTEAAPNRSRDYVMAEQPDLRDRRILIVDDNKTNREVLTRQTGAWGMRCQTTASPHEALEWIKRGDPFDVAVLDLQMPQMDGLTLANEMRRYRSAADLPIVLLASRGAREGSADEPALTAYLAKPLKASRLHAVLVASLRGEPVSAPEVEDPDYDPLLAERLPLRILLAEDNAVNQKLALSMLGRLGYRADVAGNGLEVLEALERQPYDVILMDVQMPELDGLEAAREICRRWLSHQRPRMIAMTANAMQSDREACMLAGMDDYIAKPVRMRALQQALERVGAQHEGGDRKQSLESNEQVLDRGVLAELRHFQIDGEPDLVSELIALFLAEAPMLMDLMCQAVSLGDSEQLRRAAHTLKSSSSSLGAHRMSALCAELEQHGRSATFQGTPALLGRLGREFERARDELEAEMKDSAATG